MGYTTEFEGRFKLDRRLYPTHAAYLRKFNETRRMDRDVEKLKNQVEFPDPLRIACGLTLGAGGQYFVGAGGDFGQQRDSSILNYNKEPEGQPSLWCKWTITDGDKGIEHDDGGKFYDYVEWLEYLIKHFLEPWGYVLNGKVGYQGEDDGDFGVIEVVNNVVNNNEGDIYEEED